MKYIVRARSIDKKGKETIRDELIDTIKNELFKGCQNFQEVANNYQAFWDMDTYYEKVCVLGVLPINLKIKHFKDDPILKVKV